MGRVRAVSRMARAGAVCGGLLGLPLGAAVGLIAGICTGQISWGLDGAVFGLIGLSAAGALVAAVLELLSRGRPAGVADDGRPVLPAR